MGLLQGGRGVRVSGSILFTGIEIVQGGPEIAKLRGTRVTMIFQDPTSALNPTFTIRNLFRRVLRSHNAGLGNREADRIAEAGLADTQIDNPRRVLDSYAFQLSGGMNQRVMIAMALVSRPALLIADEPGTALDVTVQAATLRLMHDLTEKTGTAVLLISHNLGVVREFSDRVYVIYRGSMAEHGTTAQLFRDPRHPYTRALLSAVPRIVGGGLPQIPERSPEFSEPLVVHPGCGEPGERQAA
jgi:ABC-type dipeptide/oligopeptide/nickel transport system ATPase component